MSRRQALEASFARERKRRSPHFLKSVWGLHMLHVRQALTEQYCQEKLLKRPTLEPPINSIADRCRNYLVWTHASQNKK